MYAFHLHKVLFNCRCEFIDVQAFQNVTNSFFFQIKTTGLVRESPLRYCTIKTQCIYLVSLKRIVKAES